MKKVLIIPLLIFTIVACQNERIKTLNSVDGSWTVSNIVFKGSSKPDSVVTPVLASINFDKCGKSSNERGPGNCTGQYTIGNRSYRFSYQVQEGKTLFIGERGQTDRSLDWTSFEDILGSYTIVSVSDDALIFEGFNLRNGYRSMRFVTKK